MQKAADMTADKTWVSAAAERGQARSSLGQQRMDASVRWGQRSSAVWKRWGHGGPWSVKEVGSYCSAGALWQTPAAGESGRERGSRQTASWRGEQGGGGHGEGGEEGVTGVEKDLQVCMVRREGVYSCTAVCVMPMKQLFVLRGARTRAGRRRGAGRRCSSCHATQLP